MSDEPQEQTLAKALAEAARYKAILQATFVDPATKAAIAKDGEVQRLQQALLDMGEAARVQNEQMAKLIASNLALQEKVRSLETQLQETRVWVEDV